MYYLKNQRPEPLEKIVAALCYLSSGLIGLLYLLFSGKHARTAPFFYFHFLQSIILGIFIFLLGWTGMAIKHILAGVIALICSLFSASPGPVIGAETAIDWLMMLINDSIYLLLIYGFIFALLGKYAEIPGLSALVRKRI